MSIYKQKKVSLPRLIFVSIDLKNWTILKRIPIKDLFIIRAMQLRIRRVHFHSKKIKTKTVRLVQGGGEEKPD